MEKDLLHVSYATMLETLQNIARTIHAYCLGKHKKMYGRWNPKYKENRIPVRRVPDGNMWIRKEY